MKKYLYIVVVSILVAVIGYLIWQNWYLRQDQINKVNQETLTQLGEHLLLPTDENPTIATIQDAAALKAKQSFFTAAENGDQLIIYTKATKAIIYRADQDLIVNVGPLNFTTTAADTVNEAN